MKNTISLAFTGDIGFDRYMDGKWNDDNLISDKLLDFLHDADHVIANVEGPLFDASNITKENEGVKQLIHTMDPAAVRVLRKIKADVWNICNNHIMDAGEEGVKATLNEAQRAGALTVGAGMDHDEASRPLFFKEAGGIGLFSVGYRRGCKPADTAKAGCFLWNETEAIRETIQSIKKTCRWCIIIAHAGEEFTSLPSPYTRDRYLSFLEMGADIIVCHHPHVPMNYETFTSTDGQQKAIFYSLGNFIFDTDYQRAQFHTEKGVLLKLLLSEDTFSFEAQGLLIDRNDERIKDAPLPDIFTDVRENDYNLLAPLSAKAFLAATKRRDIHINPARKDFTDADWEADFQDPKRSGRVEGEALDFRIIVPFSHEADKGLWKESKLAAVKEYILKQI